MNTRPKDWSIKPYEEFWVTHQPYLLQNGYRLPARYHPNWIPSWETNKRLKPSECPDSKSIPACYSGVLDAIRISDGTKVVLKLVQSAKDVPILEYLNSPALLADPRNHTVPLLGKIPVPDREDVVWIVMPFLISFHSLSHPFRWTCEVMELVKQFLEGLEFMHEHQIAHRDACTFNLMVDSSKLMPNGDFSFFRPSLKADWSGRVDAVERRSVAPLKYYFIDFEMAQQYSSDGMDPPCIGRFGQVRNVPEFSDTIPYNPFKLDVYQLGTALQILLDEHYGIQFLVPLCEAMTRADPEKRPTAAEAHRLFKTITSSFTDADMNRKVGLRSRASIRPPPPAIEPSMPYMSLSSRMTKFFRLKSRTSTFLIKLKLIH